ncbi:hypothetical protein GCM10009647_071930 [Streptomyces sanglieri]
MVFRAATTVTCRTRGRCSGIRRKADAEYLEHVTADHLHDWFREKDLLPDAPEAVIDAADLPVQGLHTMLGSDQVRELAAELVRPAREGLRARVAAGLEHPQVLGFLDPLDEVLHTGRTFAEQCAHCWETDLRSEPARCVEVIHVAVLLEEGQPAQ